MGTLSHIASRLTGAISCLLFARWAMRVRRIGTCLFERKSLARRQEVFEEAVRLNIEYANYIHALWSGDRMSTLMSNVPSPDPQMATLLMQLSDTRHHLLYTSQHLLRLKNKDPDSLTKYETMELKGLPRRLHHLSASVRDIERSLGVLRAKVKARRLTNLK